MKERNTPITSKPNLRYLLSASLFCLWLFSSGFSLFHTEENTTIDCEHNCHLCLLTENSSPEITLNLHSIMFVALIKFIVTDKQFFVLCLTGSFLTNSDPPLLV
jgi:hypothetical protein